MASFFDARIVRIKRIFHSVNPVIVKMIPSMGSIGINGHRTISMILKMPPITMMAVPAINKIRRETKPTARETSLSKNIWNLRSNEAEFVAELAEIWRYGLKRVRMSELMEKKSVMLARAERRCLIKMSHP